LHADTSTVDQADLADACLGGRMNIFLDNRWNVAWSECVEVERPFDGNVVGHF
jgi:hypothetical protein